MRKRLSPARSAAVSSPHPELKLAFCSAQAARYACENWHYSRTVPVSKSVKIGVWEGGQFIGVVLFAWGANKNLSKPYGLQMIEVAELVRVALKSHSATVSKILGIACRMLKKQSPNLRLLVSFADTDQGHNGGIYQASNWIYTGQTSPKYDFMLNGKKLQNRAYSGVNFGRGKMALPIGAKKIKSPPKHRYLYPLDKKMRKQIESLAKPYPKRAGSKDSVASSFQDEEGGAIPTPALQRLP
jgi:hypothetical protein